MCSLFPVMRELHVIQGPDYTWCARENSVLCIPYILSRRKIESGPNGCRACDCFNKKKATLRLRSVEIGIACSSCSTQLDIQKLRPESILGEFPLHTSWCVSLLETVVNRFLDDYRLWSRFQCYGVRFCSLMFSSSSGK